jgi:hypothetical protein
MIITQIKRSYSKTINTQSFGAREESWVKIESELSAYLESNDDPKNVSDMLYNMAREDVLREQKDIITKIKNPLQPIMETRADSPDSLRSSCSLTKL